MFREVARYANTKFVSDIKLRSYDPPAHFTPPLRARHPRFCKTIAALKERPQVTIKYPRSSYEVGRDAPPAPRHRPCRHNRDHRSGDFASRVPGRHTIKQRDAIEITTTGTSARCIQYPTRVCADIRSALQFGQTDKSYAQDDDCAILRDANIAAGTNTRITVRV